MKENPAIAPLNHKFLPTQSSSIYNPNLLASLNLLEIRIMDTKCRPSQFIFLRETEPAAVQSRRGETRPLDVDAVMLRVQRTYGIPFGARDLLSPVRRPGPTSVVPVDADRFCDAQGAAIDAQMLDSALQLRPNAERRSVVGHVRQTA